MASLWFDFPGNFDERVNPRFDMVTRVLHCREVEPL
jgi:hypothetical protein